MKIILVSSERDLYATCQGVLQESVGAGWDLTARSPGAGLPLDYDLCIWDFAPSENGIAWQIDRAKLQNYFFILHRQHLKALHKALGTSDLHVLLKPVSRPALKALVGEACLRWKQQHAAGCDPRETLRSERDEMLQCLIQANLNLQEYDQERTNFLARAVHDFRAPLTALCGYCGLMLSGQLGAVTPEQKEALDRMQQSAKRLSHMADAMFQLSIANKIDRPLNFQKGDLRECIDQALYEVAPFAEEKRIAVSMEMVPPPEALWFERSQIEQVLVNLLENACKFTPRSGSIEVKAYPFFWERRRVPAIQAEGLVDRRVRQVNQPNAFRVDIRDSGPGIPPSHLEKIFEEYTSYSGGQDRSGGGLGLAICKMIMNQHQGCVWAENGGAGTTFSFVLPVQRSQPDGLIHSS